MVVIMSVIIGPNDLPAEPADYWLGITYHIFHIS